MRKVIGPIATPDTIVIVPGLPKTRSGKMCVVLNMFFNTFLLIFLLIMNFFCFSSNSMRRLLRKIANHESSPEQLGDVSTLADPAIVQTLIDIVNAL